MAGRNDTKKSEVNSVETLAEVFRCFICMEKLQDAHLCPHCSKLCCYACIRRWLTEQRSQCPHCRATLLLFELVNCRWVEEVTQNLDTLRAASANASSHIGDNNGGKYNTERCPDHPSELLTVYCEHCNKGICHRCALWGGSTHDGHSFKPIAELHEHHVQKLKSEMTDLKQKYLKLSNFMQNVVELRIERVRAARDEKANEVYRTVELMISRLDAQLKSNISTLTGRRGLLAQETAKLEAIINDVEHKLATYPPSELIQHSDDLTLYIKSGKTQPFSHLVAAPVLGEFKSEIVPPYDSGTFVIQNFSRLQGKGDAVYSPPLHVHGLCWRLKVYPNGNGIVRGLYLSIFLELTAGLPEPSKYEYRIEMIHQTTQDHRRNIVREFVSDFEVGECWGYNRFFRLDLLSREGYMSVTNDSLELKFQVRAPTYFQKCRDQEWYINQLQALEAQYSAQINELKEKTEKECAHGPSVSGSIHELDDVSGPVYPTHQMLESRSAVENPKWAEEPTRELSVYSSSDNSAMSNNASSTNSRVSHFLNKIFVDLNESDSDEPSNDESDEETSDASMSPGQIRVVEGIADQVQSNDNGMDMSRLLSWISSTPTPSAVKRLSVSRDQPHPSRFRRLSRMFDEAGVASHQATSDAGDHLNPSNQDSPDCIDVEAIASNLSLLVQPLNQAGNSETDAVDTKQLKPIVSEAQVKEVSMDKQQRIQLRYLEELANLQLSESSPQLRTVPSAADSTLSDSELEILNESSPRSPVHPLQQNHLKLPFGNSYQNRAANRQTVCPNNQVGRSSVAGLENIDNANYSDEA